MIGRPLLEKEKALLRKLIGHQLCQYALCYQAELNGENGEPNQSLLDMWKDLWSTLNRANQKLGGRDYGSISLARSDNSIEMNE